MPKKRTQARPGPRPDPETDPGEISLQDWLSMSEASDVLEVTVQRVWQLAKAGRIERLETSIGFFYSRRDVERLREER